jgi:hypothetical protein
MHEMFISTSTSTSTAFNNQAAVHSDHPGHLHQYSRSAASTTTRSGILSVWLCKVFACLYDTATLIAKSIHTTPHLGPQFPAVSPFASFSMNYINIKWSFEAEWFGVLLHIIVVQWT